jgi:predicted HicB family RNase H-like nuclease
MKKSLSKNVEFTGSFDKDLDYFMGLSYPYSVEEIKEDGKKFFSLSITDLPGCGAEGATIEEARTKLEYAKEAWIQTALDAEIPIPEPVIEDDFSGKFLLRIPPKLHMRLSKRAAKEGISLNQLIRLILEENINYGQIMTKLKLIENSYDELRIELVAMNIKLGIAKHRPSSWQTKEPNNWKVH